MNRPVKIPFDRIIQIDRESRSAVYIQIAQQIVNAIQRGYLLVGSKLPGSRSLSEVLGVHRQTIVSTYEELELQGWVETLPNKGTFVLDPLKTPIKERPYKKLVSLERYPQKTGYSIHSSNLLDDPLVTTKGKIVVDDGQPDYRLSSLSSITSEYTAYLKRSANKKSIQQNVIGGSSYFKVQLSNYLNLNRGLHISSEHLFVTRSTELCLYVLSKVLIQKNDIVIVGSLSYYKANMILQEAGAKLVTIPIDEEGIDIDQLERYLQRHTIRAVYVNPNRHYPTTVSLSAARRIRLLQLAKEYQFVIIEDEFDMEIQYERSAILPLISGDIEGMVVYLGSFGKSLAPGFHSGFVVAPENLIIELRKHLSLMDYQGNAPLEQVLGMMIEEGNYDRFQRKLTKQYQERRDLFCFLLEKHWGKFIRFEKPSGGLAVWVSFKKKWSVRKFAQLLEKRGIEIPEHLLYQDRSNQGIRLGFGAKSILEINKIFKEFSN